MIIFLATNLKYAQTDIKRNYHIMSARERGGEVIYGGQTVPFRIAMRTDDVRGLRVSEVIVLPHAELDVNPYLVKLAMSRKGI